MPRRSAGILLYRRKESGLELLLVHPGGPFWARKDDGAWSIPKGEYEQGEDPATAARREFAEETGCAIPADFIPLGEFRQPGGKLVTAFAAAGDLDPADLSSNFFSLEWPPKSGRVRQFPEVDRAAWYSPLEAQQKILRGQRPIIEALLQYLRAAQAGRQPSRCR